MGRAFLCTVSVTTATVTGALTAPAIVDVDISSYRSWTKVNKSPAYMEPMVSALCIPTPAFWSSKSQHLPRYFTVYVNDIGKKAMLGGGKFPVSSIIVKEKFAPALPYRGAAKYDVKKTVPKNFKHPELLTIMIKRDKGYSPKCGDWEFRTATSSRKVDALGDVSHCVSCHKQVPATDYTYRSYVAKSP